MINYILSTAIVILTIMVVFLYRELSKTKQDNQRTVTHLNKEIQRLRFADEHPIIARHYGEVE